MGTMGLSKIILKLKQNLHILLLAALIMLSAIYMLYWGAQKQGFHVDEMWTLMDMSGNEPRRPYFSVNFHDVWHDGAGLVSAISVSENNAFTQPGRSNPYFVLLHIAYSFIPGVFSIWPAIILNIVFYIGTLIVMYLLSRLLIDNKYLALLPPLLWGISSAAIDIVVFIRFYSMVIFFSTLLTYIVFITIQKEPRKWRFWAGLVGVMLTLYLGFRIHQFFFVYAFFVSIFAGLYLLFCKKFKMLFFLAGAILSGLVVYHFMVANIANILGGRLGQYAIDGLLGGRFHRVAGYAELLSEKLFAGVSMLVIFVITLLAIFVVFLLRNDKNIRLRTLLEPYNAFWAIMLGVCVSYFLVIAMAAPSTNYRYISYITPMAMLVFVAVLIRASEKLLMKSRLKTMYTVLTVSIPISLLLITNISAEHLYTVHEERSGVLAYYHDVPVICVNNRGVDVGNIYWYFIDFNEQVLFTLEAEPNVDVLSEKTFEDGLLLFVSRWGGPDAMAGHDVDEIVEHYLAATGLRESTLVWIFNQHYVERHNVYFLSP